MRADRLVAAVWLVHGLYNKLLAGSPRHLAIVQSVPGLSGRRGIYMLAAVGIFEVLIGMWVLSRRAAWTCAATQSVALLSMNVVELIYARRLLLWPAGLIPVNLVFLGLAWTAAGWRGPQRLRERLRRHPFAVQAHFDGCLTLTYAVPETVLQPLLPAGLELDTWGGFGFVAVALVQTRRLRPAALPGRLGQDFFLAGYRIFTRFKTPEGRSLRGLQILRSDTNRTLMKVGGNLLTHYNYHRCEATIGGGRDRLEMAVRSRDGNGDLDVSAYLDDQSLPAESPFPSVREARRFAGPRPFTFDYERETNAIITIRASRAAWDPQPVAVDVARITFFDQPAFAGIRPRLAAAFHASNIDYRWERGVRHAL